MKAVATAMFSSGPESRGAAAAHPCHPREGSIRDSDTGEMATMIVEVREAWRREEKVCPGEQESE